MDNQQFFKAIKKLVLPLILLMGSLLSMPAYAWPDVDHMNMCGAPAKVVRAYGGNFRGWTAHDNYVAKRGNAYYYRTMCPQVKAVKNYKKKTAKKVVKKRVVRKAKRIARSSKAKSFKRKVKYNEKADCIRVDRMNASGPAVRVVRR